MTFLRGGTWRSRISTKLKSQEVSRRSSNNQPDVEELWNDALNRFRSTLRIDPRDQSLPFVRDLERLSSSDDILDYLQDTSECLSDRRQGSKASRALRKSLKPLICGLSVILDASSETASALGVPGGKGIFAAVAILLQAADCVSAMYDDLQKLLDGLEAYVTRLKVRVQAPMREETRQIAVKGLIEVLKTLELATKVVREGRARRFVKALLSKANGVQSALARLEAITMEEEMLAIADLAVSVHASSQDVQQASSTSLQVLQGVHNVRPTIARTDITTRRILGQTSQMSTRVNILFNLLQTCLEANNPANARQLEDASARVNEALSSVSPQVASQTIRSRVRDVSRMGRQLLNVVSNFGSENQDIIWRGFGALLSFAVDCEATANVGSTALTWGTTSLYLTVEAMGSLVHMGCMFILLFMIWQQSFILRPMSRSPGTVIIVDVLGEIFELQSDTFSTWKNTHDFLLQAFKGRKGLSFVQRRDYALGDSNGMVIEPQKWALSVRPGSKLNMSVIIRDGSARCPYCQHATITTHGKQDNDGRIVCSSKSCGRSYSTVRVTAENPDSTREISDTMVREPDSPEARLSRSPTSGMTERVLPRPEESNAPAAHSWDPRTTTSGPSIARTEAGRKDASSSEMEDGSLTSFYRIIVEIKVRRLLIDNELDVASERLLGSEIRLSTKRYSLLHPTSTARYSSLHLTSTMFKRNQRADVMYDVQGWIEHPACVDRRALLVIGEERGVASVAREIATQYSQMGRLASSFTFDVSERQSMDPPPPQTCITTLARDLADFDAHCAAAMRASIASNPNLAFSSDCSQLFEQLVLKPASNLSVAAPVVVVIDGLDFKGTVAQRMELPRVFAMWLSGMPSNFRFVFTIKPDRLIERALAVHVAMLRI
ncbi:unnamed protein product [Peniophora sp. CBMAI 1063]|nr:unnamed protein product [Peniophora sp. CBMAI 1063]